MPGHPPLPDAPRAPNGYDSGYDAPPAQASDDISMKSPILRLLGALPGLSVALLLAACGGGGGDGGSDPGACCYVYPDPIVVPPGGDGVDPLLAQQWHLANTGQSGGTPGEDLNVAGAAGAWSLGATGSGVRVAVVDDAIEVVHEDLWPNFVAANGAYFNYRSPGSLPLPYYLDDDHGTAVAGVVLARNGNAIGGAGVAPRAELAAYNPLATNLDADIADALRRDNAATGVYNNSWGSPDNGVLNPAEASFITAIEAGITSGRGGRGSVYVFPAGNGGCYLRNADGSCALAENSNFDGYVNKRGVIAACAIDDDGRAPVYAEPGANILVCGRSGNEQVGITTTTPQSAYRADFSGTSASTPMVSGVVALMLEANPNLTWRDVRLILAYSARRNDTTDPGWTSNFNLDFNPKYGFGAVDAAAAVTLARNWTSVGGTADLRSCTYSRTGLTLALDDNAPVTDAIDASACQVGRIEFVEVRFSATHSYAGDLRVELLSPAGLTSLLANERVCNTDGDNVADDCGSYDDWAFGSVRHLDEPSPGQWRLRVLDAQAGDTGIWTSWTMTIWGR